VRFLFVEWVARVITTAIQFVSTDDHGRGKDLFQVGPLGGAKAPCPPSDAHAYDGHFQEIFTGHRLCFRGP